MRQILVLTFSRCVRPALLVCGLAALGACGQKGNLYLPTDPAAASRATLPQATGTALRSVLPARTASQPTSLVPAPAIAPNIDPATPP